MATSRNQTKPVQKRRGIISLLFAFLIHLLLLSLFAWMVLLVGFGTYRLLTNSMMTEQKLLSLIMVNTKLLAASNAVSLSWTERTLAHDLNIPSLKWHEINLGKLQEQEFITGSAKLSRLSQQYQWDFSHEVLPILDGVTEIILGRILIFILSIPLFLLCLSIGLVDGLVQRDIRKFQGARESTLLFHETKRGLSFWFYVPLLAYMVLPWPVSPTCFLVPMAMVSGFLLRLNIQTFKKYI